MAVNIARALRVASCIAGFALLVGTAAGQVLRYADAVAIAGRDAPLIAARQAAIDSASSAAVSAGALPDPRLSLGVDNLPIQGNDRFSFTSDPMTMGRVGIMQDVPNAEKRLARVEGANARVVRERAQLAVDRAAVQRDTAIAWINRHAVEKRIDALDALNRENRIALDTANAEVAGGRRPPADALMARQETAMLDERRDELARELAKARATLRRFVGDAADRPLAGDPPAVNIETHRLHEAVGRHVELVATAAEIDMARAEAHEAAAAKRPDWGWEVAYQKRAAQYGDMISFQVRIDLPILQDRRQEPLALSRQRNVARLEAELDDMRRRHLEELEGMLAERDELARKVERLRNVVIDLAEQRAQLQLASYGAGKADLASVLSARREVTETLLKAIEAEGQLAITDVKLAYFTLEDHS